MDNLWNADEAAKCATDLALRVYTSRLLGRDHTLVLHGGGNTSVKVTEPDLFGQPEEVLYVKGSGWDLETIEEAGFAPVRLEPVRRLAGLDQLSDPQMMNALATHVTRAGAPAPSVETILHAILPYKFVDHTHADAFLAVRHAVDGEARAREIYGDDAVVIPYVMPGFDLAKLCARLFPTQRKPSTIGMVLLNHGVFSFGDTAEASYSRMIELVGRAEAYLQRKGAWEIASKPTAPPDVPIAEVAELRASLSRIAGAPLVVSSCADARHLAFARRADVARVSQQGPATPDHVLRTKRVAMIGRDVAAYAQEYAAYFERHSAHAREKKTMLDPAPRVVVDPQLGVCSVGRTPKDANIVADLYSHTIDVIERAEALGGYTALPERDIFDVEYWDLEQAKLRKAGEPPVHAGEIVLVTGAASGIGKACVSAFLKRGAAVVGLDIDEAVTTAFGKRVDYLGVPCDVTDETQIGKALSAAVRAYGGVDMLVLNAGIFPAGQALEGLSGETWRRVMSVNLDANLALMRLAFPLLELAPRGGRVVVIGSKNVPAPGPGAAAYSASKAALTQLARVAALEWGEAGIRINTVHPNAVFDTGIWTDEVLKARAAQYGMTVDEYKRSNVLKIEVTSTDVAEMAVAMCGPVFAKTTGAQVPVDGGNDRVI